MSQPMLGITKEDEVKRLISTNGTDILLELGRACLSLRPNHSSDIEKQIFNKIEEAELEVMSFLKQKKNHNATIADLICLDELGIDLRAVYPISIMASTAIYGQNSLSIATLSRLCARASSREKVVSANDLITWRWIILNHSVDHTFEYDSTEDSVRLADGALMQMRGGVELMGNVVSEADIVRIRNARFFANNIPETIVDSDQDPIATLVGDLPTYTPQELFNELETRGYVGQVNVRKRLCVAICNHVSRLRSLFIDGEHPDLIPRPAPILISGPTGSGKTHLIRTLCEIVELPFAIIDITQFSEIGYVGKNVQDMLVSLCESADSLEWGQHGILICDEIDKITDRGAHDLVSRAGVQRSLLKILEGHKTSLRRRSKGSDSQSSNVFDTTNTFFIGLGVFPSFAQLAQDKTAIGFQAVAANTPLNAKESETLGFSGELFSRFTGGLLQLDPLSQSELETILRQGVVQQYSNRLAYEEYRLHIEEDVYACLASQALDQKTNARGLQSAFLSVLQDAEFELKSDSSATDIVLYMDNGAVQWKLDTRLPDDLFESA